MRDPANGARSNQEVTRATAPLDYRAFIFTPYREGQKASGGRLTKLVYAASSSLVLRRRGLRRRTYILSGSLEFIMRPLLRRGKHVYVEAAGDRMRRGSESRTNLSPDGIPATRLSVIRVKEKELSDRLLVARQFGQPIEQRRSDLLLGVRPRDSKDAEGDEEQRERLLVTATRAKQRQKETSIFTKHRVET